MGDCAIQLRQVTKGFYPFARPREMVRAMLARAGAGTAGQPFWALKGVTLDIPRGQTWGIVGRNGSGKSTLLQIIAGTMQCTSGDVQVTGRVAALLQLGSGFHPEFTGRENVLFQGHLQGCTRQQIEGRFDQIADFAGVGEFMDRPVKTYSSGMMLRLAFAVTIALDPDILIVDEALAVGDEAFQGKCFARIRSLRERGCTVLFVSHSGQHIIELCNQAVLLDAGDQLLVGPPKKVISLYHKLLFAPADRVEQVRQQIFAGEHGALDGGATPALPPPGTNGTSHAADPEDSFDPHLVAQSTVSYPSRGAQISEPQITRLDGTRVNVLERGRIYRYTYQVSFARSFERVRFGMMLKMKTGFELGGGVSHTADQPIPHVRENEVYRVSFEFQCMLQPGVYFANAGSTALEPDGEVYLHRLVDALMFRVRPEGPSTVTGVVDFGITATVARQPASSLAPASALRE